MNRSWDCLGFGMGEREITRGGGKAELELALLFFCLSMHITSVCSSLVSATSVWNLGIFGILFDLYLTWLFHAQLCLNSDTCLSVLYRRKCGL